MLASRGRRLRNLSINSLAPNILTILALCAGLTSIRFALQERWELAVAAVVLAGWTTAALFVSYRRVVTFSRSAANV